MKSNARYFLSLFCLTLLCMITVRDLRAQNNQKPCSQPEISQFDFWLGEWELTWSDSLHGTNIITRDYDGCVTRENFTADDGSAFKGMSVSVYNPSIGKWCQTWVDNQGAYLDFIGEFRDGKMVLSREAHPKDKPSFMQRMVWYEIKADSFKWNWERSDDSGKTWRAMWVIDYKRKK